MKEDRSTSLQEHIENKQESAEQKGKKKGARGESTCGAPEVQVASRASSIRVRFGHKGHRTTQLCGKDSQVRPLRRIKGQDNIGSSHLISNLLDTLLVDRVAVAHVQNGGIGYVQLVLTYTRFAFCIFHLVFCSEMT